ncbi:Protein-lysine N-methyltransferase EFM6 [Balamuthia mandrillaris]
MKATTNHHHHRMEKQQKEGGAGPRAALYRLTLVRTPPERVPIDEPFSLFLSVTEDLGIGVYYGDQPLKIRVEALCCDTNKPLPFAVRCLCAESASSSGQTKEEDDDGGCAVFEMDPYGGGTASSYGGNCFVQLCFTANVLQHPQQQKKTTPSTNRKQQKKTKNETAKTTPVKRRASAMVRLRLSVVGHSSLFPLRDREEAQPQWSQLQSWKNVFAKEEDGDEEKKEAGEEGEANTRFHVLSVTSSPIHVWMPGEEEETEGESNSNTKRARTDNRAQQRKGAKNNNNSTKKKGAATPKRKTQRLVERHLDCAFFKKEGDKPTTKDICIVEEAQRTSLGSFLADGGIALASFLHHVYSPSSRPLQRKCIPEGIPEQAERTSVLELGSGTGLVGMVCSCLGMQSTTLTDLPELVDLLRQNIATNFPLFNAHADGEKEEEQQGMQVQPLDWADEHHLSRLLHQRRKNTGRKEGETEEEEEASFPFNLIVAADVTYSPDCCEALLRLLQEIQHRWRKHQHQGNATKGDGERLTCIIGYKQRTDEEADWFFKQAEEHFELRCFATPFLHSYIVLLTM